MPRAAPRPEDELAEFTPDPGLFRDLPDGPGIYRFLGDNDELLYVGKSVHLRERVKSHFAARYRDRREHRLAWLTRRISWTETAGELGALLRENHEIKTRLPVFNRKQRHARVLHTWHLRLDDDGLLRPELSRPLSAQPDWRETGYGLFRSPGQARKQLERISTEHGLCRKLLGLERGRGACFAVQLGRCRGACRGDESPHAHNQRLKQALTATRIAAWPREGPLLLPEPAPRDGREEVHVIDQWRYLGSRPTADEARTLLSTPPTVPFDLDSYRILLPHVLPKTHPGRGT
jgi:DNA polymerase-3 subunit epsilon